MKDLYALLPDIIIYLVLGFLFLKTYCFSSLKSFDQSLSDKLIESLLVGFVLKKIYDLLPSATPKIDIIGMILTTIVAGWLFAIILTSAIAEKIRFPLHIKQDGEPFIWRNLMGDKPMWATLINYNNETYYYGRIVMIESFERKPQILLTEYKYEKGEQSLDFSQNPEQTVLLDTSNFQDIRISYAREDSIINSWIMKSSNDDSQDTNIKSEESMKSNKKSEKSKKSIKEKSHKKKRR